MVMINLLTEKMWWGWKKQEGKNEKNINNLQPER